MITPSLMASVVDSILENQAELIIMVEGNESGTTYEPETSSPKLGDKAAPPVSRPDIAPRG